MGADIGGGDLDAMLVTRLSNAMDRLRGAAVGRDASRFVELFEGTVGVGVVYDAGRRARAWMRGERFDPAHGGHAARPIDER